MPCEASFVLPHAESELQYGLVDYLGGRSIEHRAAMTVGDGYKKAHRSSIGNGEILGQFETKFGCRFQRDRTGRYSSPSGFYPLVEIHGGHQAKT
jgi:hypothetical protein